MLCGKCRTIVTALAAAILLRSCSSFRPPNGAGIAVRSGRGAAATVLSSSVSEETSTAASLAPEAVQLKDDLLALAATTRRGFSASRSDREKAKKIVNDLAKYCPSDEPAAAYFAKGDDSDKADRAATLAGKWTLAYTDAPDITSLEGAGPFPTTAKLGRIGQECDPPTIKNVIEWRKPDWAASLPFGGGESSRVLQKVVCEGAATRENPRAVDLTLLGLELSGADREGMEGSASLLDGPAAFLESNPLELRGPLTAPFGKFEILYLDDGMRITKTYQGYFAVNVREDNVWF
mmetsp:Transcript_58225/g.123506  ORF Transcript_58225/g.123506 Transcript_58225/m.123506 type:complete len:292 (-) Transcript_58225:122-997(-)